LDIRLKKSFKRVAINPDHLFEQADKLAARFGPGPPRQVDVRRAISAAYYGLFHAILAAAADQAIGVTRRSTAQYALAYRSIDHATLRRLCDAAAASSLPSKYARYAPANGFGLNIAAFAKAFLGLQEMRHAADYDPLERVQSLDAVSAVNAARAAWARFNQADETEKQAFLSLLLFPPR
jgi:uncharacterized protein (UPF0332 family)